MELRFVGGPLHATRATVEATAQACKPSLRGRPGVAEYVRMMWEHDDGRLEPVMVLASLALNVAAALARDVMARELGTLPRVV